MAALIGFGYSSGHVSRFDALSWIIVGSIAGPSVAAAIMLVGYFRLKRASR